jgi:hypothetical protein
MSVPFYKRHIGGPNIEGKLSNSLVTTSCGQLQLLVSSYTLSFSWR